METQRIHRLLRLITILQSGRARHRRELQAELGISRRTLYRDLKMLQVAGVPVYFKEGHGYRIAQHFFLPAVNLSVPETLGLLLITKTAAAQRDRPYIGQALSAVSKLLVTVPEPIRQACSDLLANVSIDPGAQCASEKETEFYPVLQRCIDERRRCQFEYQSPTEDKPLRCLLDPYALHFAGRAWYVLGRVHRYDQVRVLKLARFIRVTPMEVKFTRPRRFHVSDKLGLAWQLNPEGKLYHVELEFTPMVATNVSEVRWHPTQEHTITRDGRCLMKFHVDGLSEIGWWVCGYADQVKVLKPSKLRDLVSQRLQNAVRQYQTQAKD